MNEQSRESLDSYYAEAASWNRDRVVAAQKTQRLYGWIAGAAVLIAVLEGLALVFLTPLKTVVPYTVLVDRNTGYVQALDPLRPETVSPDSALTQAFLVQYVIGRESFDLATINDAYRRVAMASAGDARSGYLTQMQGTNPNSPINVLPRGMVLDAKVKSVSPLGKDSALVRFDTVRSDQPSVSQSWVAVVRYRYSGAPMKLEDRFINPLGFQVVNYRKNAEALSQVPLTQPTPNATIVQQATTVQTTRPTLSSPRSVPIKILGAPDSR